MDSPVLVPYERFVSVDRTLPTPVYLQVAHQLIRAIQQGYLADGLKLPGTRRMGHLLGMHRNTVVASYAELETQGWLVVRANSGAYVRHKKPDKPRRLREIGEQMGLAYPDEAGFPYRTWTLLDNPFDQGNATFRFDDGLPDPRLSHTDYLSRLLHTNMKRKGNRTKLGYDQRGTTHYYQENLANFLNLTRGLRVSTNNLLVTRSVELGIYIVAETLLAPGDIVVVAELSYFATNMIFQRAGATVQTVPVDDQGIDVTAVETLFKRSPFRMLYLTPHHHYPTTVPLSIERREALLKLSSKYGFIILEDDYDYDFHYDGTPLLPMASADTGGMVVYVGAFGKSLVSGFRSGFIVAPSGLIQEMNKLLSILDRYGDVLTELALGELIAEGEIHRYLRKSVQLYRERRNRMAALLAATLGNRIDFTVPDGGLAIWTKWPHDINLVQLRHKLLKNDLYLPRHLLYQSSVHCGIRLGFGSMSPAELERAIDILAAGAVS